MSYNYSPEWTDKVTYPEPDTLVCPFCKQAPSNTEDSLEEIESDTYYVARHIPKELWLTCDNINCEHCDEDFRYELSVVITATPVVPLDTPR